MSSLKRKHLEIEKDDIKTEVLPDVKTPAQDADGNKRRHLLPDAQPRSSTSDMCAEGCSETLNALLEQASQDKSGDLFVRCVYAL